MYLTPLKVLIIFCFRTCLYTFFYALRGAGDCAGCARCSWDRPPQNILLFLNRSFIEQLVYLGSLSHLIKFTDRCPCISFRIRCPYSEFNIGKPSLLDAGRRAKAMALKPLCFTKGKWFLCWNAACQR